MTSEPRGLPLSEVPTPALLVDADILASNLVGLQRRARRFGLSLRPHAKTHRCPAITRLQLEEGAVGVACAKLGEAEVMVDAGVSGILITTQVVSEQGAGRMMRLLRRAPETTVVVDDLESARLLSRRAETEGVSPVQVLIDLDVGARRTGVAPGPHALALADGISQLPCLHLCGLQGYAGQVSHLHGWDARRAESSDALQGLVTTAELLGAAGHRLDVVAGGSTGTHDIDAAMGCFTELQCGSYALMDLEYRAIGGRRSDRFSDFGMALTVLSTVVSVRAGERAILDAGVKAFATDTELVPEVVARSDLEYSWAGDEHGRLTARAGAALPALGERLRLYPPHCDPTVNLYDRLYAVRGDLVVEVWPITARGRSD